MAFVVKVAWAVVPFVSHSFKRNQMEFEENFGKQAFKHMDALRDSVEQCLKEIQFLFN